MALLVELHADQQHCLLPQKIDMGELRKTWELAAQEGIASLTCTVHISKASLTICYVFLV